MGEILDGAISSIRANPKAMIGTSVIVSALVQLVEAPVTWFALRSGTGPLSLGTSEEFELGGTPSAARLAGVAVGALAQLLVTGLLTTLVSRAVLGERVSAGQAWRQVRPRIGALLAAAGLYALVLIGLLVVLLGPGLLLLAAGSPLAPALLVLGGIAALCLLPYAYVSLSLTPQAVVLERQGPRRALTRSRALVRRSFWRVFGILLLIAVLGGVMSVLLTVPFSILTAAVALGAGTGGGGAGLGAALLALGGIVSSALTWPFLAAASTLLYVDLRMRREGLDITLARAAGQPGGSSGTSPVR